MYVFSQNAADETISEIWSKFCEQLKIKRLQKQISKFNQQYVQKYANSCLNVFTTPIQNIKKQNIFEDLQPATATVDEHANFMMQNIHASKISCIFRQEDQQKDERGKTGLTYRTSLSKKNSVKHSNLKQSFILQRGSVIEIKKDQMTKEQVDLQLELRAIQKKLYFSRSVKKQEQQNQAKRLDQIKKRRIPIVPKSDFTFQFSGNLIKRTFNNKLSQNPQQMRISHSYDLKQSKKKSYDELIEKIPNQKRKINSRYQNNVAFNNLNKRQVSHLPFIKMSQNTSMREQNRNTQGNRTERVSLLNFSESNFGKQFLHYAEKQKVLKSKQMQIKVQNDNLSELISVDKNPEQMKDQKFSNSRRRQSYLMTKYVKKLNEQNLQESRKSHNFNKTNFPKAGPIHDYYRHNFDDQLKRESEYQNSIKVLDEPETQIV